MSKKAILCILYTTLLIVPATILGRDVKRKKKRNGAVLPFVAYAVLTVALPVFLALVLAYSTWTFIRYHIHLRNDNHSCANNWGWCRPKCFRKEYPDWYHCDVRGFYKC
ncbi:hypothetical protein AM593_04565, partial [Mytilus galloprovincialis]